MDILGLLLPQRCAVCACPDVQLCGRCRDALRRLTGPLCARCGAPTAWPVSRCRECSGRRIAFRTARGAIVHNRAAVALVAAWKERGLRNLACIAAELTAETIRAPPVDALTFIPPDSERGIKRGHHPAGRLARELAARWQLPVEPLLARPRPAERQRGLSLAERRRNVAGVFSACGTAVPCAIALVDDVYTTGATASSAASALRKAGAREIHVVTFTRAVRGYS
jgi:predicted amidophosphoribosyltransferase